MMQVRKRGGKPRSGTRLRGFDITSDGAPDMVYFSREGKIRVVMPAPARTCANLFSGKKSAGVYALKLGSLSGDVHGDILC
jgi:hypothetical protein